MTNQPPRLRHSSFPSRHPSIVTGVHPGAMTVPVGAVQISNNRNFVYVLRGDRVQRREVQLGVDGEDWLEVHSGLSPDDEVVSAGLEGLSDQAQVRPARGVELFGNSPKERGGGSDVAFNIGGAWKLSKHLNLLFPGGRDIVGDTTAMAYVGLQVLTK